MRIINIIKPNPLHITQFTFRKLPGRIEAGIWQPYWMTGSETSIKLFKEMHITCTASGKRMEVLRDFDKEFPTRYGITRGSTEEDRAPENCPFFINTRDRETIV